MCLYFTEKEQDETLVNCYAPRSIVMNMLFQLSYWKSIIYIATYCVEVFNLR